MVVTHLEFKNPDDELEFLHHTDPRLRGVAYDLSEYCWRWLKKPFVITDVVRTRPENEQYGVVKETEHFFGRAWDARSSYFTPEEIRELEEYVKAVWGNDFIKFALHTKGTAPHLHCSIHPAENRGDYAKGTGIRI